MVGCYAAYALGSNNVGNAMATFVAVGALDPVSALVATAATPATVHLFAQLGIPGSTSQAIVEAVVGVGLTKGVLAVNLRTVLMIPAAGSSASPAPPEGRFS
ncbi:MAG: hypothetical protein QME77_02000 [bacterium]|nr:hypothetical protein [bacterium]